MGKKEKKPKVEPAETVEEGQRRFGKVCGAQTFNNTLLIQYAFDHQEYKARCEAVRATPIERCGARATVPALTPPSVRSSLVKASNDIENGMGKIEWMVCQPSRPSLHSPTEHGVPSSPADHHE